MLITHITKRNGSKVPYEREKITTVINKAFKATETGSPILAEEIALQVEIAMSQICDEAVSKKLASKTCIAGTPSVEEIQDLVEAKLMESGQLETAKAYILYRAEREKARSRHLFEKRRNLKPYEYPELLEFVDAVRHSYWVHTEFNFTGDIQDFKLHVNDAERTAISRAMLAISQIEVAVKTFWGDLYKHMPKPEIGAVGFTFAESEVRHMDAYSHLLEILGLNEEFKTLQDQPAIKERIQYLERVLALSKTGEARDYAQSVLLFSLFIEHVSLFSQFLIMMSFNKQRNIFKGIANAVAATSKEEQLHGLFGIQLINLIKEERPEWFDESFDATVIEMCHSALEAEEQIVDWICEEGELSFLPKAEIMEFIKERLNNSLIKIGMEAQFEVDEALVGKTEWFDEEVITTAHTDFFYKRSVNYSKKSQSVTTDDLF